MKTMFILKGISVMQMLTGTVEMSLLLCGVTITLTAIRFQHKFGMMLTECIRIRKLLEGSYHNKL